MKRAEHFGARVIGWSALVALALGVTTAGAATEHQGYAKVRYVVGQALVSKGTGAGMKIERYQILHAGDTVKTDARAHVDLMLGWNNGSFQVTPGSEVTLDKLTYQNTGLEVVHDTQLNLKSGAIAGLVNKMAAGSKYDVKTTKGIARISGTRYKISANGDTAVTEGRAMMALDMADGSTKTFTIDAGKVLIASVPEVRALSSAEKDEINDLVGDAITHGGYLNDQDPETLKFFLQSQQEPYVSPVAPE